MDHVSDLYFICEDFDCSMRRKGKSQWNDPYLFEVERVVTEQVGESHCRLCGEDHPHPYDRNSLMYGSPIVVCPHCKGEQLIYGRLEPALDQRFVARCDWKLRLFVSLALVAVMVACYAMLLLFPSYDDAIIYVFACAISFFCLTFYDFWDTLRSNKKYGSLNILKKSRMRMQNEDYVRMLLKLGYDVPKKFRPKHYVTPPLFKPKPTKFDG